MNREELAWAAGIIDGEGSFLLSNAKHVLASGEVRKYPVPTLTVSQATDGEIIPQMLLRLQKLFPAGHISSITKRRAPARDSYKWVLHTYEQVQAAMTRVWPWMSDVKRKQAKNMFARWEE